MLNAIPLMIVPFILYNLAMVGLMGSGGLPALHNDLFVLSMISGAMWSMSLGDLFIVVALVVLFFEILKATATVAGSLVNHMLSMLVFIAFLVEFLLVQDAATQSLLHSADDRPDRRDRRLCRVDPQRRARCVDRALKLRQIPSGRGPEGRV
jgi:uncharacterized membrane protein YkvI